MIGCDMPLLDDGHGFGLFPHRQKSEPHKNTGALLTHKNAEVFGRWGGNGTGWNSIEGFFRGCVRVSFGYGFSTWKL